MCTRSETHFSLPLRPAIGSAAFATIESVGFVQLVRLDIVRIGVAIHLCSVRVVNGHAPFADRIQRDLRLARTGIMLMRLPNGWRFQLNPWGRLPLSGLVYTVASELVSNFVPALPFGLV